MKHNIFIEIVRRIELIDGKVPDWGPRSDVSRYGKRTNGRFLGPLVNSAGLRRSQKSETLPDRIFASGRCCRTGFGGPSRRPY